MSTVDARYDRYADIFENPTTDASIELGNRVLHAMFMENWDANVGCAWIVALA